MGEKQLHRQEKKAVGEKGGVCDVKSGTLLSFCSSDKVGVGWFWAGL